MPLRRATGVLLLLLHVGVAHAATQARDGGTLVRRLESDVNTLNYVLQTTRYERIVLQYLYDPLIDLDRNLQPIAGTAARWEVSKDHLVYTLHIDPRSTFSDGKPVLAADVLFTIRKITDEHSPQFSGLYDGVDLAKTKAVNSRTVRVVFNTARVDRWYAFNIGVLPEHVYDKADFKTAFDNTVIGNGPYTLVKRERGQQIVLERRRDYWRTKPHIQRVIFNVIADPSTAWNAMKIGDIDEMRLKVDRWHEEKDRPDVTTKIKFYEAFSLAYNCIAWNGRDPILKDPRVRRALSMSFDTRGIIKSLYYDQARPVTGPFTPDEWAYNPKVLQLPFDLKKAAAVLDQAGWHDTDNDGIRDRNGQRLAIDVQISTSDAQAREQSQILQAAVKTIGVDMTITPRDGAALFGALMKGNYQGAFLAWTVDPEPDIYPLFHSKQMPPDGFNIVGYSNPEVDKLIEQSHEEFDFAKRRAIFHRLHAILAADQPYTWTMQVAEKWAVNRRVQDVAVSKGFGLFLWYPGPFAWSLSR